MSRIFHRCIFVPHFHVSQFHVPHFQPPLCFTESGRRSGLPKLTPSAPPATAAVHWWVTIVFHHPKSWISRQQGSWRACLGDRRCTVVINVITTLLHWLLSFSQWLPQTSLRLIVRYQTSNISLLTAASHNSVEWAGTHRQKQICPYYRIHGTPL